MVANPADGFVARTLGFKNVLRGVVLDDGETLSIECSIGVLPVAKPPGFEIAKGSELTVLVDENGITISGHALSEQDKAASGHSLRGMITERVFRGDRYELRIRVGEGALDCHASAAAGLSPLQSNSEVTLTTSPASILLLGIGG